MTIVYEHPESRRELLTAAGAPISRADAEALDYTVKPYAELLEPSQRIATTHGTHTDLVSLPPFGLLVTATGAKRAGFTVSQIAATQRATPTPDPKSAWRSSIFALSEAQERPAATAELVTSRTPETLTVDHARAFLRGLPVESEPTETQKTMTTNEDPRAARLAEIGNSMAAFNKNRGYTTKATPKPALSNIEPARLKRLAELRYSFLHAKGQGMSQEAKTLRLALETHDKVGTPLANALRQLGVDASKLLPSI